jgi:hypothetical protein
MEPTASNRFNSPTQVDKAIAKPMDSLEKNKRIEIIKLFCIDSLGFKCCRNSDSRSFYWR